MTSALRPAGSDIGQLPFCWAAVAYQPGQVEHALGDDLAAFRLSEGHQLASGCDINGAAEDWSVPSAQQDGLAPLEPCRIPSANGQRRDVVQRGLNREKSFGEADLAGGGSMAHGTQVFQRNHGVFAEGTNPLTAERRDMAQTAQRTAHVAG